MLTGRELGIGPMTSLRHVQIVKGVPTLSAEYKRARVLAAGHEFDVLELTTVRCRVSGRRRGSAKPPLEITFTMDDAKRAGLLAPSRSGKPGAWQTRPRRMLFARAGSELCDFMFADVVNGLPTAELVGDGDGDDSFAGYNEAPAQASPAPAARTARRRQPTPDPTPVSAAGSAPASETMSPDATARTARPDRASDGLPPLPGEDEPDESDYDTPGTVGKEQLTAMWATFTADLGFTKDDKAQARGVCEKIIGRQLIGGTTGNLSRNEASACIDTLKRCRTRDRLVLLMNDGELPDDDAAGEPAGGE
jgi:hypothetical protein